MKIYHYWVVPTASMHSYRWYMNFLVLLSSKRFMTSYCSGAKTLYVLRHGQAQHNPRAEAARNSGCSKEEFLELMRQDDCLDSPLTDEGRNQARSVYLPVKPDLVVASPLSRALATADLACGSNAHHVSNRISYEGFREINGWLLNAKRRSKSELEELFPHWDFGDLSTDHDALWGPELEREDACGERGYLGLLRLLTERQENTILLVVHGGLLSFTLNHEKVQVKDKRYNNANRCSRSRFSNCELRKYSVEAGVMNVITLTELDIQ